MTKECEETSPRLKNAQGFGEVWEIVEDPVKVSLGERRVGMMLFLDDLPLRPGAYHPLETKNIVLICSLADVVKVATDSKFLVNAFVYVILLYDYLHALGRPSEGQVRPSLYEISSESFGKDQIATKLAEMDP